MVDWEQRLNISKLLETYTIPKVISNYYPGGRFGFDKEGRPVVYELPGRTDFRGLLHSARTDDILKSAAYRAETSIQLCKQQSEKLGKDISAVTLIYDLDGLGLKHLWRPAVKLFNTLSTLFQDRYPDLPKRILVVRAGTIFPVAFALVKPILNEKTKQKLFVFGSNWQSELQKFIDASELPVHYGGDRRDPDGDPTCKSQICYGGDIPSSYHINSDDMFKSEDYQQAVVKAGEVFSISKDITVPGSVIQWEFKTSAYDIGFSVFYEGNKQAEKTPHSINVVRFDKKQSHMVPEESLVTCDKTGKYVINFDNSYSWTRSKRLSYRVTVIEPEGIEA